MKYKVLRYKKEFDPNMEFIRIEDMGAGPEVFTSDTPNLQPETATYDDLRKYMESDDYYEGLDLDWDKVELVEYELTDSGEVGADIRNKLGNYYSLVQLVELLLEEKNPDTRKTLKKLIRAEIKLGKESVEYLAELF